MWSAGHGLIVCVLALLIGMLLNAPSAHKAAYTRSAGWKRDVALGLTGPLAGVSHALLLDRPRKAVQAAIGRSGEDDIDTQIALPPPTRTATNPTPTTPTRTTPVRSKPKPSAPAKPTKVAFTPKHKLKIWIAGDSLVITPGYAIVRAAGTSRVMESVGGVDGRVATGLTRPDVYNWFDEIRTQVKELHPDVVVLDFGGNDDKAYMTGLPDNVSIDDFGGSVWRKEYARRVGGVMDTINHAGGFVVWIGLPQTRSPDQTARFDVVNAVVEKQARKRPGRAVYLDTYRLFAGDDGGYTEFMRNLSGSLVQVRAADGVHFEREGGDMIAREVLKALNRQFDLTSWRKKSRQ
jgi:hypothetical protein